MESSCGSTNLLEGFYSKENDSRSDGEGTHSLEKEGSREETRGTTSTWLHVVWTATRQNKTPRSSRNSQQFCVEQGETRLQSAPIPIKRRSIFWSTTFHASLREYAHFEKHRQADNAPLPREQAQNPTQ